MKRPHEKESTRRLRRAHESISNALASHARGHVTEEVVKDTLFRHRDVIAPAMLRTLRRIADSRQWKRNSRPAYPGRAAQTITIRAVKTPVTRSGLDDLPSRLRYIHSICLYVVRKRKGPNNGWNMPAMVEYLAAAGIAMRDGRPWTVESLGEALNPSEAWEMLRR